MVKKNNINKSYSSAFKFKIGDLAKTKSYASGFSKKYLKVQDINNADFISNGKLVIILNRYFVRYKMELFPMKEYSIFCNNKIYHNVMEEFLSK